MSLIFLNFQFVSEEEISQGIADLVARSSLPIISLDRVYYKSRLNLEIARLVDEEGRSRGLGHRPGTSSIMQQIKDLQMSGVDEVIIVDDVIFTGSLLEKVINLLSEVNIRVSLICAGIGVVEGIERISRDGCKVVCVRTYKEIIDEVCERDFYPGVPLSGRLLVGDRNIGVPYLLPFQDPEKWASIPSEHAVSFSKFCLRQTISLFSEIERCSNKPVFAGDLGRQVIGLPIDESHLSALRKIL